MRPHPRINLWVSDYGEIRLPNDFPSTVLTMSGWFDRRFGIYANVREYIEYHTTKLRIGAEQSGFMAMPFGAWLRYGSIPNRLKGVTVNSRGEAV